MTKQEIISIFSDIMHIDIENIDVNIPLWNHRGAKELDILDLLESIDDKFGTNLYDDKNIDLTKVSINDLVTLIKYKTNKQIIMDYEKLYKDALERAKALSEGKVEAVPGTTVYECIFPELKKKSNEQIIDALIECYALGAKYSQKTCGVPNKDILVWLEKQKKLYEEANGKDFREFIANLAAQFPEVSFAKLSRIVVRVKKYLDTQNAIESAFKKDNDIF